MLDQKIFKAYDVRGIYPDSLNEKVAYEFGRALVTSLKVKNVVIGRDARISSKSLKEATEQGVLEQGADIIDIGFCTTPLLNFTVAKHKNYQAGIMVTASHNPKEYNGYKLCRDNAQAIGLENGLDDIRNLMISKRYPSLDKKGKVVKIDALEKYIAYLKELINFDRIKSLKVVVDASNCTAGKVIEGIFNRLNCNLIPLNFKPDGNFPNHEPNPLKDENLVQLQEKVKQEQADLGAIFDGDSDRVRFVDEKGKAIAGDLITAFLLPSFLKKEKGASIVYDLRSSWTVREEIEKYKGKPAICRVGHTFIKQKMRELNAPFGGELSGHYYFRDLFYTDNADFAMLIMMGILSASKESLSQLIFPYQKYFKTEELNFEVEDQDKTLKKLENFYKKSYSKAKFQKIDGLTVELPDFWLNTRPSNTEPVLRLNLEAKSQELMEEKTQEFSKIIKADK